MAYESLDWVWSPDETTPFSYTGNLATMASSIENKVGRFVYSAEGIATPTDTANFAPFVAGREIELVREGKFVSIYASWSLTNDDLGMSASTFVPFATIPPGFRPKHTEWHLMNGTGRSTWMLRITSSGVMSMVSREDVGSFTRYWMPISLTYLAQD